MKLQSIYLFAQDGGKISMSAKLAYGPLVVTLDRVLTDPEIEAIQKIVIPEGGLDINDNAFL